MTTTTVRDEIAVGRRHNPAFAWPTLVLLGSVLGGLGFSVYLAIGGVLAYWQAATLNAVLLYGTYTVVHEGVHDNIVPRGRWRWVNVAAAFLAAVPLWMLIHPHRKSHMVHHTRCNTDEDPDIDARCNLGFYALWRTPLSTLGHFNPLEQYRQCRRYNVSHEETVLSMATFAAYTAIIAVLVTAGYAREVVVLWLLPLFVGYGVMLIFFTWVPHHPHTLTGRYHDTRCSLWPGGNLLTQGQNYHLIHHMMPWIPWYRYETVYQEIEPQLCENHALIDGFRPRSAADAARAHEAWRREHRPSTASA